MMLEKSSDCTGNILVIQSYGEKAPYLYANVLNWPSSNEVVIQSLKKESKLFEGHIDRIELLGLNHSLTFNRTEVGLIVKVDGKIDSPYPVCLKIKID